MQICRSCFKNNDYSNKTQTKAISAGLGQFRNPNFGASTKVVFLLDSVQHSKDLQHFAHAISKNMDINPIEIEVNPNNSLVKQILSLKQNFAKINSMSHLEKPDYVALPATCNVPLLNLSDRINTLWHDNTYLTPKNISDNKEKVLDFLRITCQDPDAHRANIGYMDKLGQGMENVYGLIQEINKAVRNGIKVYLPTGHPQQDSIKWLAKEQNLKPELRHYISTGIDTNDSIKTLKQQITDRNWYNFNLLTLSDAQNVNLKDAQGSDHLYSAFDSCIKEAQRGVYNFSPVRKNEKIVGFSFFDENTVQYPLEEYSSARNISQVSKFVGLPIEKVLASVQTHEKFAKYLRGNSANNSDDFLPKIFKVNDVFTPEEIIKNKINLKGDYVDSSLSLYFRTNKDGNVIFPNCDYEKSGRPSVVSMWGSCFSSINAIKRNMGL